MTVFVSKWLHHILRGQNEQPALLFLWESCWGHWGSLWTCHRAPLDFINSFFTLQWQRDHRSNSRYVTTLRSAATHSCAAKSAELVRLWRWGLTHSTPSIQGGEPPPPPPLPLAERDSELRVQQGRQLMFPFPEQQLQADLLFDSVTIFVHICSCSVCRQKLKGGKTTAQVEVKRKRWSQRWLGGWTEKKEYLHMEKEREMWGMNLKESHFDWSQSWAWFDYATWPDVLCKTHTQPPKQVLDLWQTFVRTSQKMSKSCDGKTDMDQRGRRLVDGGFRNVLWSVVVRVF